MSNGSSSSTPAGNGNKYILAIDLGTSGPKAALVNERGEVVDYHFEETRLMLLPDGGAEQDPDNWWNAIIKAARTVLDRKTMPAEDIVAVCTTTQWSGTVAVDKDGKHLMNAIIWMDSRGKSFLKDVSRGFVKVEGLGLMQLQRFIRLTAGIPSPSGKDPIAHILYIKNEFHAVYEKTYKFLEPKDYINLRLTGLFAASYDSIALHWVTDNRKLDRVKYDKKLLKWSGIAPEKLPELKQAADVLGPLRSDLAGELGLSPTTQVIMGTPDIQSAALGSGATKDYEAHVYIGTSSWMTCHVPFKKTSIADNMATLPSAIPNRYFIANEQETAGECLKFLRDKILFPEDDLKIGEKPADVMERFNKVAATAPPGSDQVIFLPWLYGERTPIEDHSVRGGFYNLSLGNSRAHMVRAVFEGVAYNSRWLLEALERFTKRSMSHINMIGGGAVSDLWCQIYADVLNRKIKQVEDPIQANVRGAGFLGCVAMGFLKFEDISDRIAITRTYEPNPANRKLYDDLFTEYVNIYKANRKIFARLNTHRD